MVGHGHEVGKRVPICWIARHSWHHFASLVQETALAGKAKGSAVRYHHRRASLFFGIAALESFLNEELREVLKFGGLGEAEIRERIRRPGFKQKLKDFPAQICGKGFSFDAGALDVVATHNDLRGEITHPKGNDSTLYAELDVMNGLDFELAVTRLILEVEVARGRIWDYWLLGWNFVGEGGDAVQPLVINNQQFLFGLQALGFDVPAADCARAERFQRDYMTSWLGFECLRKSLAQCKLDIEPFDREFPHRPRLCRRWWDSGFIESSRAGMTDHSPQD